MIVTLWVWVCRRKTLGIKLIHCLIQLLFFHRKKKTSSLSSFIRKTSSVAVSNALRVNKKNQFAKWVYLNKKKTKVISKTHFFNNRCNCWTLSFKMLKTVEHKTNKIIQMFRKCFNTSVRSMRLRFSRWGI